MHLPEHNSIKKLQCHFFMRWPTYSSSEQMLRKRKILNILWYYNMYVVRKFGLFLQGYSHITWLRKRKQGWLFSWQGPYLHYWRNRKQQPRYEAIASAAVYGDEGRRWSYTSSPEPLACRRAAGGLLAAAGSRHYRRRSPSSEVIRTGTVLKTIVQ